jgi:carboxypeptidase C (cathepsin A)
VNPYSWGNKTNNIFMEAPAGVGFSYCDTAAGCSHTDTSQAVDNLAAIKDFFSKFPELQANDFWITGESYAGIYIPTLAQQVIEDNAKKPAVTINLKGILVGNGCIGNQAGHCGNDPTGLNDYHDIQIWRGHALVSETNYDNIMKNCDWPNQSAKCDAELQAAANAIGDIDVYYLYNTCDDPVMARGAPVPRGSMLARVQKARRERRIARGEDPLSTDPNCYATAASLESYLNTPAVKTALHVPASIQYSLCSNNGTFNYNSNIADERKTVYPTITASGVTVVIYNGETQGAPKRRRTNTARPLTTLRRRPPHIPPTSPPRAGEADLCVPYTDNEWWTRSMNYTVKSPWAAWSVPGEHGPYVGGYLISYENNFHFATVRGAGHMVPETRSEASLAMMSAFVLGKRL